MFHPVRRFGHENIVSAVMVAGVALCALMIALLLASVISPAAGASTRPKLPHWVHVYHSRYRSGPHMARCYVVGNGTHLNGIVCANGKAYSAAESNAGRPFPHGREYTTLPDAVRFWHRPGQRIVTIGAGKAGSTLGVTRRTIRES